MDDLLTGLVLEQDEVPIQVVPAGVVINLGILGRILACSPWKDTEIKFHDLSRFSFLDFHTFSSQNGFI